MYAVVSNNQIIVNSDFKKVEVYEDQQDAQKTVDALKVSLPFLIFEAVKVTIVDYCGECFKDFEKMSVVHYAFIENNCFCTSCKEKLNIAEWEKRFFIGGHDERQLALRGDLDA